MTTIKDILYRVEKPSRYVGGEFNLPDMNKPRKVNFCMAFPDIYEVGMSNLGIQILYDILNRDKDIVCERCFAPWVDMGKELKSHNIPLMSIETQKPLKDFDVIGISIQYELAYSNVLYLLDLAEIPFYAKDRGNEYPILLAGGPCSANPEPFADFFDVICVGDGEEFSLAFAKIVAKYKGDKKRILAETQKLEGAYIPSLSTVVDGMTMTPVKKAVVKDLNKASYPIKPLVPNLEVVHNRPVVELFRGCYAGCRFCQAGFYYRPIRARENDKVIDISSQLINNTGCEEIGFSSLSSGDYIGVIPTIEKVFHIAKEKNIKLQLPSLRLDSFTPELAKNTRRSSLTFAPEAGSQRLRDVINKNITDEDIDNTMRSAFRAGYRAVKLYFMIGLPTETRSDLWGIVNMVKTIQRIYYEVCNNRMLKISVSTAAFVPKAVTPFQWVAQISMDDMYNKQQFLRGELSKMRGVSYSWSDQRASYLEAIFARGKREYSKIIVDAYMQGAYFDGWSEYFKWDIWDKAITGNQIDVTHALMEKDVSDRLPWDFIDYGISRKFLEKEYKTAILGNVSEGCKYECKGCGANKYAECQIHQD